MNDTTNNTQTQTANENNTDDQQKLRKRYGCNSYHDFLFSPHCSGGAACANMSHRIGTTLEQVHGDTAETLNAKYFEPLQWWILNNEFFAIHYTDAPIFYDEELNVYCWPRLHGNDLTQEGYTPKLHNYEPEPKLTNSEAPEDDDDTDGPED